jgi:hypothetical protein
MENRETLDFEKIWPASSFVHLIAKKNPFLSKRGSEI